MITYNILAGTTDVSVVVRIIDSTDGTPETGVVFNTSGIDMQYRREGAAVVDITEATLAALTTAHSDGGFLHIANGYYRLDLPDAACAAGANGVLVEGTVTGMIVIGCYIQLTNIPVDVRAWLGTAPATPTVAGVPEVDVTHMEGGTQTVTDLKDFADAGYDPSTNKVQGVVLADSVTAIAAGGITAGSIAADAIGAAADAVAEIADAVWDEDATGHQTQGTFGQAIGDPASDSDTIWGLANTNLNATVSSRASQTSVDTVDDFLDTEIAAIKAKTDLIPGTIDGKTFSELVTLIAAVLLGKASGLDTTTAIYRAVDDSKDRITATVDADGNRSAVTLDSA
jgi:hypothetical protein